MLLNREIIMFFITELPDCDIELGFIQRYQRIENSCVW